MQAPGTSPTPLSAPFLWLPQLSLQLSTHASLLSPSLHFGVKFHSLSLAWGYNSTNAPVSLYHGFFFFCLWFEIMIVTLLYAVKLLLLMLVASLTSMLQTGGWHAGHEYSHPTWHSKQGTQLQLDPVSSGWPRSNHDQSVAADSPPCAATLQEQSSSHLNVCGDFTTEESSNDQI